MAISLVSYNTLFNKALQHIDVLLKECSADIVCLQEVETTENSFKYVTDQGYELADFSNSFIKFGQVFGLATFYNPQHLECVATETLNLPRSYYEILLLILRGVNNPRTVLKTTFRWKRSKKQFTIYNLHLSSWSTNKARARQVQQTLNDLAINESKRVIIAGDFNYPYGRKKFESLIHKYQLKEATNSLFFTMQYKFLKLIPIRIKLDYILYKNITFTNVQRLPFGISDHFPIFCQFRLGK